jgi:hypothetical protein
MVLMASTMSSGTELGASEWTQQSMLNSLMQKKWLLVGAGCFLGALWLFSRRSAPEEQAARRLVRDWRNVDDPDDVRDLLGSNLPPILRPVLLTALEEIEAVVDGWFRRAQREINRL